MTVCTNDVACGDLVEDRLPVAVADAFGDVEALVSERVRDVALAMLRVVLAFVVRPALPAVVVALPAGLPAPGEVRQRFGAVAAPAGPREGGLRSHEHMFPCWSDDGAPNAGGRFSVDSRKATGSGAVW
jgi:hypothetical protein